MPGLFRAFRGGAPFEDRRDAGRRLARGLSDYSGYRGGEVVVFGLPRGGVPVAFEVALSLGAPLDVLLVRKLGAPGRSELGVGAVAQGGKRVLNASLIEQLDIPAEYIERESEGEWREIEARERLFRVRRTRELRGATAVLIDDGLATGATAQAAVLVAREIGAGRIVLAAPVCAPQTARMLRPEVDELVCLQSPRDLGAIGFWYRDFEQVSDEEVVELLEAARAREPEN